MCGRCCTTAPFRRLGRPSWACPYGRGRRCRRTDKAAVQGRRGRRGTDGIGGGWSGLPPGVVQFSLVAPKGGRRRRRQGIFGRFLLCLSDVGQAGPAVHVLGSQLAVVLPRPYMTPDDDDDLDDDNTPPNTPPHCSRPYKRQQEHHHHHQQHQWPLGGASLRRPPVPAPIVYPLQDTLADVPTTPSHPS